MTKRNYGDVFHFVMRMIRGLAGKDLEKFRATAKDLYMHGCNAENLGGEGRPNMRMGPTIISLD